jgi:CubicO group peptidase (beta-lactamase class C family)
MTRSKRSGVALVSSAIGALSYADRIADHVPELARHGKGDITLYQVLTHQGGYPSARP